MQVVLDTKRASVSWLVNVMLAFDALDLCLTSGPGTSICMLIMIAKQGNSSSLTFAPGLQALGQRCMAADPHDRPTFEEIGEMLKPLQQL